MSSVALASFAKDLPRVLVRPFFAVAFVLGIVALPGACFAQTTGQTAPNPPAAGASGNTLNLTLETGPAPEAVPQPSATPAPPVRRIFITNVPQPGQPNPFAAPPLPTNRNLTVLSSRSNGYDRDALRQNPNAAPTVSATLGLVLPAEAQLRMGRTSSSRLLNVVHKGMYLAVVADGDTHWGVLMVNNTMGWINKSALQMIDYHTEVSLPRQNTPRQLPAFNGGSGSAASIVGSLTEGLEARSASILREAFTYLGVPYVWAGNTRAGLDCSAFVKSVYAAQGVRLPRTAAEQARVGRAVGNSDDLLPGDRLYFDMGRKGRVSHCGIYVGNGLFIHASTNHGRVDVDPLSKPNYSHALVAVRR